MNGTDWIGMDRLEKLKALEVQLYDLMQAANSRSMAVLARQYRDTLREIEEIEGGEDAEDEIAIVLRRRKSEAD